MMILSVLVLIVQLTHRAAAEHPHDSPMLGESSRKNDHVNGYCSKKGEIVVTMRPPAKVQVNLGDRVSLVCAGHGSEMGEPYVYWVKGLGHDFTSKGKQMGPVAIGKSILYIPKVTSEDIDTYRCVIKDCCSNKIEEINTDIEVPDETCKDVYGIGNVVYGAVWQYKLFSESVEYCTKRGMELALPRSPEENAQLLKDLGASFHNHPNAKKYAHENWIWIGASDAKSEGDFIDIKTGEPLSYRNFKGQQPDNWTMGGKFPQGQDCAGISRKDGSWDDSFSHYRRPFVCRCPKNSRRS